MMATSKRGIGSAVVLAGVILGCALPPDEAQLLRIVGWGLAPPSSSCIWTLPDGDANYSGRWSSIKGQFTKGYLAAGGSEGVRNPSRLRNGEASVWQRRFWEHWIRDEEDFRRHLDYIHFNPVKHGYVRRAADWPWSSFHRYVRMGWYDEDWGVSEPESIRGLDCIHE